MSYTIQNHLNDFLSFLKKPTDKVDLPISIPSKFKIVLTFFVIELPVMLVLILIMGGLESAHIINTENHAIEKLFKTMSTTAIFFLVVIIAPLVEELIFRLYLRYETNLLIGTSIRFSHLFLDREKAAQFDLDLNSKWSRFYPKIFYFSALLFGLVHLVNYEISPTILLFSPILVAPQIVLGLIIGFLRLRYGFWTGFMMHSFHNLFIMCISIIGMQLSSNKTLPDSDKKPTQELTSKNSLSINTIVYSSNPIFILH